MKRRITAAIVSPVFVDSFCKKRCSGVVRYTWVRTIGDAAAGGFASKTDSCTRSDILGASSLYLIGWFFRFMHQIYIALYIQRNTKYFGLASLCLSLGLLLVLLA